MPLRRAVVSLLALAARAAGARGPAARGAATCYAKRYPDLKRKFCNADGACNLRIGELHSARSAMTRFHTSSAKPTSSKRSACTAARASRLSCSRLPERSASARRVAATDLAMKDYVVVDGLGKGGFSAVMLVRRTSDRKLFALKTIKKHKVKK